MRSALEPLQAAIDDRLGHWYMANHGVSAAALIEDMRTVLTAYWRLSSKRLTENICMTYEAHVLQKLSEEIESELLTAVQVGALNSEGRQCPCAEKGMPLHLIPSMSRTANSLLQTISCNILYVHERSSFGPRSTTSSMNPPTSSLTASN